ncbi:hypothetical protein EVG20_g3269 [Dentipellis fragilis]|uniref:Uncharacterized protein n=1 Tax=Dentipellis fragilis TaxID=205917 RepID=A0A4Y9Z3I9_9AGAM|nr:hypothetical protein EVG20_g3269 [Dentipellis fragilis]
MHHDHSARLILLLHLPGAPLRNGSDPDSLRHSVRDTGPRHVLAGKDLQPAWLVLQTSRLPRRYRPGRTYTNPFEEQCPGKFRAAVGVAFSIVWTSANVATTVSGLAVGHNIARARTLLAYIVNDFLGSPADSCPTIVQIKPRGFALFDGRALWTSEAISRSSDSFASTVWVIHRSPILLGGIMPSGHIREEFSGPWRNERRLLVELMLNIRTTLPDRT